MSKFSIVWGIISEILPRYKPKVKEKDTGMGRFRFNFLYCLPVFKGNDYCLKNKTFGIGFFRVKPWPDYFGFHCLPPKPGRVKAIKQDLLSSGDGIKSLVDYYHSFRPREYVFEGKRGGSTAKMFVGGMEGCWQAGGDHQPVSAHRLRHFTPPIC